METLPPEVIYTIAQGEPALLLTCVGYSRLVDNHIKYDTMIARGYTIEISRGWICWRRNGLAHRLGGPAYETYDYSAWLRWGLFHRENGPAVIDDGAERYYVHGNSVTS